MPGSARIEDPLGLPPTGTLVSGKYQLERYIAEGGMGVIALARHVDLDEPVALKFLRPELVSADPSGALAGRFVREARATIKIRSEHVPRIFDVATLDDGLPFIVMELLVGEDLEQRLERYGPLPIAFVVDLILQSLEALAAAHALGMVHRDYKPANLFLAQRLDGTACVKVLDFGIAKLVDQNGAGNNHAVTGTHAVMGSPRYMSPEQMRSSRDVDGRCDIWAVGTTLYELLTGTAPFDGEGLTQVCAAILQDEPEPMAKRRPEVPPGLEALVRRCLAKRPADRYADVADLAQAMVPFGTLPSAAEKAARVARVLGTRSPGGGAASWPGVSAGSTAVVAPHSVTGPSAPSSPGISVTSTAWRNVPPGRRSRRVWTFATAFAVLLMAGTVLGGMALVRSRGSTNQQAPRAPGTAPAPTVTVASPVPSVVVAVAPPSSAVDPGTSQGAAPSAALPETDRKKTKAADLKTTPHAAKPPAAAPTANTPMASPSAGGLWDDRK